MPASVLPEFITLSLAAGALAWTWLFYTAMMLRRSSPTLAPPAKPAEPITLSVIVATRDDPEVIDARVQNLLELGDVNRPLEIIVAVDPRSEWTADAYRARLGDRAIVIVGGRPGGKAAGLNAGVRVARGTVVVLADSRQMFVPGSLDALVSAMTVEGVAGVSGTVRQSSSDAALDAYWRADTRVRVGQAAVHSVVTTTGQIAAFRRSEYPVLPPDLICDDLYATAYVVMRGHRVTLAEDAIAIDDRTFTRTQNLQRKIRTLSGLVQVCQLLPQVLNPRKNPVWVHFMSQKVMRLLSPIFVMIGGWATFALVLRAVLPPEQARVVALIAFLPLLTVRMPIRFAAAVLGPAAFLWTPLVALYNGLRRHYDVWHSHATPQFDAERPETT